MWRNVYRATDHNGQVIDVFVSTRRDTVAARRFFTAAIRDHGQPCEVVTDRVAALAKAIGGLAPDASHTTVQYANNRVEADHGRLKARSIDGCRPLSDQPALPRCRCCRGVCHSGVGDGHRMLVHRWQTSPRSSGFLDAERRQPSPQRKLHDLETVVQRAVSEIGRP